MGNLFETVKESVTARDAAERYDGDKVCSRQLYAEALGHGALEPKSWELRDICDVMNHTVEGWVAFPIPRCFSAYGRQRGWERAIPDNKPDNEVSDFQKFTELGEEMCNQMSLPEGWITE